MEIGLLAPYEQALAGVGSIELVCEDGRVLDLDVSRWLADADEADHLVIDRCAEPTLDVGCGPGRMVRALYERGIAALGVDIAGVAVAMANERGGPALNLDVFDRLPAEGRWATILLLDGNVGIGGDVERLLARVRDLLRPGGRLVVEVSPWAMQHESVTGALWVHFRSSGQPQDAGARFPWAVVDLDGLHTAAGAVGLRAVETWQSARRAFLVLTR